METNSPAPYQPTTPWLAQAVAEQRAAGTSVPADQQPADQQPADVERLAAPSGNRDSDHFRARHLACGWESSAFHSNRTVEGRTLAERDAREHVCRTVDEQAFDTDEAIFGPQDADLIDDNAMLDRDADLLDEERFDRYDRIYSEHSPLSAGTFGFLSETE